MDFFSAMDILASGLSAERMRMNVASSNMANAQTTRTAQGGPYQRLDPVFTATSADNSPFADQLGQALKTVEVSDVVQDGSAPRKIFDPGHPDADPQGYVALPNVNLLEEMVNMITSARAYEAGTTALQSLVQMAERTLNLGK